MLFDGESTDFRVAHCSLNGRIVSLKQDSTHLHFQTVQPRIYPLTPPSSLNSPVKGETLQDDDAHHIEDTIALLQNYLNLKPDLTILYEKWSSIDSNFKRRAPRFAGLRILRQDCWETLVGFICSSNNNIVRISQMIDKLCLHYGPLIGHIGDQAFHDFPPPEALIGSGVESHLRELGFGYRAIYIAKTAFIIANERPKGWLKSLSNPESYDNSAYHKLPPEGGREGYRKAHAELTQLMGVGPKVADCVCLMGLGWSEAVPVDTHVWQIAQRDYKFGKGKHKSLTKSTYDAIGDHFRQLWGKEAGWAHSVLFAADLKRFSEKLPTQVQVDETIHGGIIEAKVVVKRENPAGEEKLAEETLLKGSRSHRAKRRKAT